MRQTRIQKTRKASQNRRQDSEQDQDDPGVHREARKARRRAYRASAAAGRFLRRTEEG